MTQEKDGTVGEDTYNLGTLVDQSPLGPDPGDWDTSESEG